LIFGCVLLHKERQRWALTVNHWEEDLVEVDVTREPLSVYYPLDAPPKKK
jgi:hypothetical protein